jgi:hypothetical protein
MAGKRDVKMPNTGVWGKVVDELGAGIDGLEVVAYHLDPLHWKDRLSAATTSSSGDFSIVYPAQAYGPFETEPDIVVPIFDPVGRILFESARFQQVTDCSLAGCDPGALLYEMIRSACTNRD